MHPRSRLKRNVYTYRPRGIKKFKKIDWRTSFKKFLGSHQKLLFYAFLLFIIIMILIPPGTYLYFAKDLKSKESVMNRQETGLTLLDRDGEIFYTFDQPKSISYIPISDISKAVQDSAVATEDKNFYTNPGFSITGILRAFLTDIFAGKIVQGGSTITQTCKKRFSESVTQYFA